MPVGAALTLPTENEAARFLTQATFGPTDASVSRVMAIGYEQWIDEQLSTKGIQTLTQYWDNRDAALRAANPNTGARVEDVTHGFWKHSLTGQDELRQRVAFALSEIFVVSYSASCLVDNSRSLAGYYDMLATNAFDAYRKLLEGVTLHPAMGCFLSHLRSQKENLRTGRIPDENFARELMQLFSIGLYQLRPDGTYVLDSNGQPVETYGASDVSGLAKVFTGYSFNCPDYPASNCFFNGHNNGLMYLDKWSRSMVSYPQFHSTSSKDFLGVTVPAQTTPDPALSRRIALDFIANQHPNIGPFIGKQLIQRLVTSNPSPAYVGRVTQAFEQSGRNMGAMVKAILLDPEARDSAKLSDPTFGKVREPILRLSAFLRAVNATSESGAYLIDPSDDVATALAQSPFKSPSVFNFFRPGFAPPGGSIAAARLVAPEMQIVNETSVAAYVNYMHDVVGYGVGRHGLTFKAPRRDVQPEYASSSTSVWWQLANKTDLTDLLNLVDKKLFYGSMPPALKAEIKSLVETAVPIVNPAAPQHMESKWRLWSTLLMAVASPEFQVQR